MMNYIKKKSILGVVAAGMMVMGSCNSWLDVQPFDSMTEEQLYSSENGIQRALNGLYLNMTSNKLYAEQLGAGILDAMGQYYQIESSEHRYYYYSRYQQGQDAPKSTWSGVWNEAYKLIANCNEFLAQIDRHPGLMSDNEYKMMKGEALAIRTLLHFDMFRLFGPIYTTENAEVSSVPYYNQVTDVAQPILAASDMMEHLITDIDSAITYLSHDVILTNGIVEDEDFWDYRNLRMNYYAALALKARICWYANDEENNAEAYNITSSLLNGIDPVTQEACNFMETFTPILESSVSNDPMFYPEVIFALHNVNREDVHKDLFSTDLDENNILLSNTELIDNLYETRDYRYGIWEIATGRGSSDLMVCTKFQKQSVAYTPYLYEIQPQLTMGELYLIAAATAPDDATASSYLEQLRINRGFLVNNMQGMDVTSTLQSEWQKELFGEGQFYYFLKRNSITSFQGANGIVSINFSISLPESETDNRRD